MKKLYALLLVIAILFAFAGCSKKTTGDIVASSDAGSEKSDDVVSNDMPDVESKAGDVVIDISELFEDSSSAGVGNSNTQTDTSSKSTTSSDSSKTSEANNTASQTVSASQMVSDVDSGTGYTSGWY